jgi:hypothetical protein
MAERGPKVSSAIAQPQAMMSHGSREAAGWAEDEAAIYRVPDGDGRTLVESRIYGK